MIIETLLSLFIVALIALLLIPCICKKRHEGYVECPNEVMSGLTKRHRLCIPNPWENDDDNPECIPLRHFPGEYSMFLRSCGTSLVQPGTTSENINELSINNSKSTIFYDKQNPNLPPRSMTGEAHLYSNEKQEHLGGDIISKSGEKMTDQALTRL